MRLPHLIALSAALALTLGFGLPAEKPALPVDPGLRLAVEKTAATGPEPGAADRAARRSLLPPPRQSL